MYQEYYSLLHDGKILNYEARKRKAKQIIAILKDYIASQHFQKPFRDCSVLDIGCSAGIISWLIAEEVQHVVGIDIDENAIAIAKSAFHRENLEYRLASFDDPSLNRNFDIVICNSVLEHMPNQDKLLNSIYERLNDTGIVFLSVPNKFTILKEPHYGLLFLSWLPKVFSNLYLRVTKKGRYYFENPPSYLRLCKLCSQFHIFDYTIQRMKFPSRYALDWRLNNTSMICRMPNTLLHLLAFIGPSFVFILKKRKNQ